MNSYCVRARVRVLAITMGPLQLSDSGASDVESALLQRWGGYGGGGSGPGGGVSEGNEGGEPLCSAGFFGLGEIGAVGVTVGTSGNPSPVQSPTRVHAFATGIAVFR